MDCRFEISDGRTCFIRPLAVTDAEEVVALLPRAHAESDFLQWMAGEFKMTVEEEREWIRKRADAGMFVTLAAVVDGRIVGLAGAEIKPFRRNAHHAVLGVTVLKEFWGQGIGRRLVELVIDWGRQRGLRKMTLHVFADNERAIHLYRDLGFIEEGRLKEDVLRADGSYTDTIVMAKYYS